MKIRLVKSSFYNEADTKKRLADFILKTDILSMGEHSASFEKNFAEKQCRKYAVFVNSGSTANLVLLQALMNLGKLNRGDRVGVSALTWATNIMPVIQLGMIPVAIDCERDTLNVSPRTLKEKINEIDSLFLTNVLGFGDDIVSIESICKENNILFFEDNCESLGSKINGRLLGNFGLASTFSFFVGHHMSTIEGGMITTDDEELHHELLMVRAHGWDRNVPHEKRNRLREDNGADEFFALYNFYTLAYNFRPTDIHGFIGNIQLEYLDEIISKREKNFLDIYQVISRNHELLPIRYEHMDVVSNFAVPVIASNPQMFLKYKKRFQEDGVEIRPIIAGDITKQPFYKKFVSESHSCPNADYLHKNAFYFGNNPDLTEEDILILRKMLGSDLN
ncbi:MAG: DegT/DnrJ/EryC1/StrS aminotransferase [Parcubacteria group bacterium CG11_big_fil_rev_8_21_14_0_20_39_22]|nr:MAG: DegT/DnrJ/EryC1/StrS aminotransferase [Parcubacteria group bacterium CG11_big_fil_rev_8_21_14_0_20_39_22]